ncbi:Bug family tripartite tricarboxylate transporter substrate binding protein [Ramlibacter sp. AN1133]|uniref:Bug family tripartite tricarboxylate transporter substrate binding protein n=1 Tax=Ramlibacter sp. AN1133 TaxID=3133429 RepID=UPI0030C10A2E
MLKTLLLCLVLGVFTAGTSARAQYPDHPIKIVVPFVAGGGTDALARQLGQRMAEKLGQPVIVENRPGAGTAIGTDFVAKAKPDGYTLLMTIDSFAVLAATQASLPYDPVADFSPIGQIMNTHWVLVVDPALPIKTFKDFVAYAKARPGQLNYGSTSPGGSSHLATEQIFKAASIKLTHIPFGGAGQAVSFLLSGQVQVVLLVGQLALPYIQAGKMRPLAITAKERASVLPDVPTLAEEGISEFESGAWTGLFAPRGTPAPVIAKLNATVNEILRKMVHDKEYSPVYVKDFQVPAPSTPADLARIVREDVARSKATVIDSGINVKLN